MQDSWRPKPPAPLKDTEILILLAEDERSEKIINEVQRRGINFQPTDEYLQKLRSSGAKDEIIDALRVAATKPLSRDQLFQALASRQDTDKIKKSLQERGIDFDPTEEDFAKLSDAGGQKSLLQAIRDAKRVKPPVKEMKGAPEELSSSPTEIHEVQETQRARVVCPPSLSSIPVFASPNDVHKIVVNLKCGDRVEILEKDSGRTGIDRILVADGTEGFVLDLYLGPSMAASYANITAPVPTYKPEPTYAPEARRDRIEGTVEIRIVVDTQGNVADAREVSPPLGGGLDEKALETVKTWKFQPAKHDGVPVPVRVTVEVTFRLYR
jgi:TonB family protein